MPKKKKWIVTERSTCVTVRKFRVEAVDEEEAREVYFDADPYFEDDYDNDYDDVEVVPAEEEDGFEETDEEEN
jgi:hypothetical protein